MYQVKVVGMDILPGLSVAVSNIKNKLSLTLLCCICSLSLSLKDEKLCPTSSSRPQKGPSKIKTNTLGKDKSNENKIHNLPKPNKDKKGF